MKKINILVLGIAMILVASVMAMAQKSQTAQSIMVQFTGASTYSVVENQLWRFDENAAAAYFTNNMTSGPTVSCGGSPTNCAVSNQPSAPAAPAASAFEVSGPPSPGNGGGVLFENQCTFLSGGSLTGRTYSQDVTINGLNGKGNWKFTWTYTVAPTQATVDPFTAWVLDNTVGASVPINAFVAGESVVSSKQHPKKYSFSLRDDYSLSRVTNLVVTVDGTPYAVNSTLEENAPGASTGDPGAVDFLYSANAGTNGVTSLLSNGYQARTILNTDSFSGNDNGGADGKALARAVMDTLNLDLADGDHTVVLTGTVKGNNAATTPQTFSVSKTIHIISPGCGQGNN